VEEHQQGVVAERTARDGATPDALVVGQLADVDVGCGWSLQ